MTGLCASWMAPLRSVHIHVSVYGWLPLVVFVFVGFAAAYVLVSLMLAFTVRWCCDFLCCCRHVCCASERLDVLVLLLGGSTVL